MDARARERWTSAGRFSRARKKVVRSHGKTTATRRRLSGSRRPRRGFQNGTTFADKPGLMRHFGCVRSAPVIFFTDASSALVHLSVHPSVPTLHGRSDPGTGGRHPGGREETPWRNVARRRLTWHVVSVDKNVTRTKLTSLSRRFHFARRRSRRL